MLLGKVSIIIRTKNEEEWVRHSLEKVFNQKYQGSFEVIIVDNASSDNTVQIAKQYPIKTVVNISEYTPGKSLNAGIEKSQGEFLVFLSAHCVPRSDLWLQYLLMHFNEKEIAGVYGRQVPIASSHPSDVRDLYIAFGLERRIQKIDTFFHNANSAIPRRIIDKYPFDESVSNVEDRLWAQSVISDGYQLVYEPSAEVFHYHGIHQMHDHERSAMTFSVLNRQEDFSVNKLLPDSMKPENRQIYCVIPIQQKISDQLSLDQTISLFNRVKSSKYIKDVFVLYDEPSLVDICNEFGFITVKRPEEINDPNIAINKVLCWALKYIERKHYRPEYLLYVNPTFLFSPKGLCDELINDACYKGLDTVFPGIKEFGNYWLYDEQSGYREIGEGFLPRKDKHPIYKALTGLGLITATKNVRQGRLIGERVGVIAVDDFIYSVRTQDAQFNRIVNALNITHEN